MHKTKFCDNVLLSLLPKRTLFFWQVFSLNRDYKMFFLQQMTRWSEEFFDWAHFSMH